MSEDSQLPGPSESAEILHLLLGKRVVARQAEPLKIRPGGRLCVGEYVNDRDKPQAVVFCEPPLAAALGAALALWPARQAQEAARQAKMQKALREHVHEVFNVMTRLLYDHSTPHVRLRGFWAPPDPVPPKLGLLAMKATVRMDLHVQVDGFGGGQLLFAIK